MSNTLKGGDESHSVGSLSGMFRALAQKMKDTRCDEEIGEPAASGATVVRPQNSILDNLPLAEEHLVFKFSSLVWSLGWQRAMPPAVTGYHIMIHYRRILFGMHCLER